MNDVESIKEREAARALLDPHTRRVTQRNIGYSVEVSVVEYWEAVRVVAELQAEVERLTAERAQHALIAWSGVLSTIDAVPFISDRDRLLIDRLAEQTRLRILNGDSK